MIGVSIYLTFGKAEISKYLDIDFNLDTSDGKDSVICGFFFSWILEKVIFLMGNFAKGFWLN